MSGCVALMEQPPCHVDEDCLADQRCDLANNTCQPRPSTVTDARLIDGAAQDQGTPADGGSADLVLADSAGGNDLAVADSTSASDLVVADSASASDLIIVDSASVTTPVVVINGDFEASSEKTWFWDWDGSDGTGALVPGAIPGWSTDDDPGIGGRDGKGDSGVEPEGNPGMRLFINSVDGEIYQTTSHLIQTGETYLLSWDMLFTYGAASSGTLVAVTTLYYLQGNTRVPIESTTIIEQQNSAYLPFTLEAESVPPQAVGQQIGIAFDNITDQQFPDAQTWVAIDNVALSVTR